VIRRKAAQALALSVASLVLASQARAPQPPQLGHAIEVS
jgi:hypothetical protein